MSHKAGQSFTPGKTDPKAWSDEHSVTIEGPSLTVQDQAQDADLNVIMQRVGAGMAWPNPNAHRMPTYDDYTGVTDFASAMNAAIAAQEAFNQYPATFRARFDNDPQAFAEWALNPNSKPELYTLGMLNDRARAAYEAEEAAKAAAARPAPTGAPGQPGGAGEGNKPETGKS